MSLFWVLGNQEIRVTQRQNGSDLELPIIVGLPESEIWKYNKWRQMGE